MTLIHAEMEAHVKRAPEDLSVIVRMDSGASTATLELTPTACHIHVRRNKFAPRESK